MSTNPQSNIPPTEVDPAWMLPDAPSRGQPVSAQCFARLCDAAKRGSWESVWRCWASGEFTTEYQADGTPRQRPARRKTLAAFLDRRADLRAILEECAQERRDRFVSQLEDVAAKVALGPPDTCTDYDSKGNVTRVRTDSRNRNYMVLALLKAEAKEKYGDSRRVEVEGQIDHRHAHAHLIGNAPDNAGGYRVSFEMLAALPEGERRAAFALLERLESIRLEQQQQRAALPPGQQQNGGSQ